jgi:hypothetical protein
MGATQKQHTANKGEWSELYVFFKILADRSIPAAGSNLEALPDKHYPFLSLLREELPGHKVVYDLQSDGVVKIIGDDGKVISVVPTQKLGEKTQAIFRRISQAEGSSFTIEELLPLMDEYKITKVKANSAEKIDLLGVVPAGDGGSEELGFSIKSHIGGLPTLINPSSHTNFIYEVVGFEGNTDEVNAIDGASKMRKRMASIKARGGEFQFIGTSSSAFNANMRMTDTAFPSLMAYMLVDYYAGRANKCAELVKLVAQDQDIDIGAQEMEYKLKGFLRSAALGMVPATVWGGHLSAYGGYIIVLDNGGVVCYHLFNDDEFKEYLYRHTKFDTPSTGRYEYGDLYMDDGKFKLKLNLQIRFTT